MNRFGNYCYTYLIGWREQDIWYYGYRSANKKPPKDDLWIDYFTTSEYVKLHIEEHGQPDVIRIHKLFNSTAEAREYEKKFIDRVNAVRSPRWLNKHNSGVKFYADEEAIRKRTETIKAFNQTPEGKEMIRKRSEKTSVSRKKWYQKPENQEQISEINERRTKSIRDFYQTEEGKELLKEKGLRSRGRTPWNKGVPKTQEARRNLSMALKGRKAWNKGVPVSEETRKKISESVKLNGHKDSPEQRRIKSEATKLWWAAGRPPGGIKPFYSQIE